MNIATLIYASARRNPDALAISWIDQPIWNYGQLWARAASLAAGMQISGLLPGDRVLMTMSNSIHYYEAMLAAWIAGLVPSPQNCRLHPAEMGYAAQDNGARLCFSTPELTEPLRAHLPKGCRIIDVSAEAFSEMHADTPLEIQHRDATDPALLFYTSGTTGRPKGAIQTHRTLISMSVCFLADSQCGADDHILHLAPMSHASGFFGMSYLLRGRNHVILPTGAPNPDMFIRTLTKFSPLTFFAVPTVVRRMLNQEVFPRELISRIHRIIIGGAPLYVQDYKDAIKVFGVKRLWQIYGQGESPNTITHLTAELLGFPDSDGYEERLASVGIARSGLAVCIMREDGVMAGDDEVGEVVVQGDTLMGGYWNRPDATHETLKDGWLHTGDLGRMDNHGFLTLVDRSKDVIISGGSNIYPREIEEVLLTHPHVSECAVIGIPHPEWGEVPLAFIVPSGEAPTPEALEQHCLAHIARYKRPSGYHFVAELPKSAYGKYLKSELRKLVEKEMR